MIGTYILDDAGNPVPCESMLVWAAWMEDNRTLERTMLPDGRTVSTVFLGLDHAFDGGPPVLWETMVFGSGDNGEYQRRYRSRSAAIVGHTDIVAKLSLRRPLA